MIGCMRAGVLLERRASGLGEADRLVLEEHLQQCPRCRETTALLEVLRASVNRPPTMRPARIEAVLQRAIDRGLRPESRVVARRRPSPLLLAAAAVMVIAVVVVAAIRPAPQLEAKATTAIEFDALVSQRVVEGSLRVGEFSIGSRGPVPVDRQTAAPMGAKLALDAARVEFPAGSSFVWKRRDATLELVEGSVLVDVEPGAGRGFRVSTSAFHVDVMGTRFVVTARSVRVERGTVRVSPIGEASVILGAGQSWSLPEGRDALAKEPTAGQEPARQSAAALLAQARRLLARGEVAAARRNIASALRANPSAQEVAEASTLRAECALVSGDSEGAAKGYEEVAERHAGSAAGENALFAAGRLAATQGKRVQAAEIFRRYLARYPKGRFTQEARARLAALENKE